MLAASAPPEPQRLLGALDLDEEQQRLAAQIVGSRVRAIGVLGGNRHQQGRADLLPFDGGAEPFDEPLAASEIGSAP